MISLRVAIALAVLIAGLSATFLAAETPVAAQSPAASSAPSPVASPILIDPLDPRGGPGASQVGAPLLALLAVLGAGVVAAGLTALYVKATRRT